MSIDHKGHGISEDLLFEPGVQRYNSDDELEELLLPDSPTPLSGRRRRKTQEFKDTDSTSSSSEDYGYVEEESLEDPEDDYKTTEDDHKIKLNKTKNVNVNDYENTHLTQPDSELMNALRLRKTNSIG